MAVAAHIQPQTGVLACLPPLRCTGRGCAAAAAVTALRSVYQLTSRRRAALDQSWRQLFSGVTPFLVVLFLCASLPFNAPHP